MRKQTEKAPRKRRHYRHLTKTDRLNIEKWKREGMSVKEIADKLRVHISTVYRELKRGTYQRLDGATWEMEEAYSPEIADMKYHEHLSAKGPELKIANDYELAAWIEKTIIEKDCSLAALQGYAREEKRTFKTKVSVPTLYSYIRKGVFLRLSMKDLPRCGETKTKYQRLNKEKEINRAPAGESIERRPGEARDRSVFGHWEADTVYSAKNTSKAALLMLTERKTRKEIIIKVKNRKAETIVKAFDGLERKWGARRFREIFKTITVDNGTEFSAADDMEKSCINKTVKRTKLYYCHPYSSFERGSNENQNGMARRKHPKGTDFSKVSREELAETEAWMNNYPRKMFGYHSSEEMFNACLAELGLTA